MEQHKELKQEIKEMVNNSLDLCRSCEINNIEECYGNDIEVCEGITASCNKYSQQKRK